MAADYRDVVIEEFAAAEARLLDRLVDVTLERDTCRQLLSLALAGLEWFQRAFEHEDQKKGHDAIRRRLEASRRLQRDLGKDVAVPRPEAGVAAT